MSGAVRNAERKCKHSHCEAKLGLRVWETKFGCVHRKTAPTGFGGTLKHNAHETRIVQTLVYNNAIALKNANPFNLFTRAIQF